MIRDCGVETTTGVVSVRGEGPDTVPPTTVMPGVHASERREYAREHACATHAVESTAAQVSVVENHHDLGPRVESYIVPTVPRRVRPHAAWSVLSWTRGRR